MTCAFCSGSGKKFYPDDDWEPCWACKGTGVKTPIDARDLGSAGVDIVEDAARRAGFKAGIEAALAVCDREHAEWKERQRTAPHGLAAEAAYRYQFAVECVRNHIRKLLEPT